jgi:hypothetical protein
MHVKLDNRYFRVGFGAFVEGIEGRVGHGRVTARVCEAFTPIAALMAARCRDGMLFVPETFRSENCCISCGCPLAPP